MNEQQYYEEIEHLIKKQEINKRARKLEESNDLVTTYWHIGKIIIEAQGRSKRAKYGNELIKKWSIKLTEAYGKGYDYTNLSRFRKFYMKFPILGTVSQLSWSIIYILLPIKNENKRNYYINLCLKNNLSVRELRQEIKSNSYERLIDKSEKITIDDIKENYDFCYILYQIQYCDALAHHPLKLESRIAYLKETESILKNYSFSRYK